MTEKTETFLDRIVKDKRQELDAVERGASFADIKARLEEAPPPRAFREAISRESLCLIAEVKKASPSRGALRADIDAVSLATCYAKNGAAAISVLTDAKYFQGSLEDLLAVRRSLPDGPPLLRKDFIFDIYQLYEARCYGADAVLLIAAILNPGVLAQFVSLAGSLGMAALVEVHNELEMERAMMAGAEIIGINNRDLRTFDVDLEVTQRLRPLVPPEKTVVSESGVTRREHMEQLELIGVNAALVGETLVTAADPAAKIRELMGR